MKNKLMLLATLVATGSTGCKFKVAENRSAILISEFVYSPDDVPFPSCHASTLAEIPGGLVCAWFGGTHEKHEDVGIWVSRKIEGNWSKPLEVVNGIQNDSLRYPTWNPVLFYQEGELMLFYKVGANPRDWWGEMMSSHDQGKTWSEPRQFPDTIWGPIRNKPVMLNNGDLLCPSSTEHEGWRVHMEWTGDLGKTWERTKALNSGDQLSAIQPTILIHPEDKLQILCRTKSNRIFTSWSDDHGRSWSPLTATELPNNNSGIDAVTLKDGRHLLVYNHIDRSKNKGKRNLLHLAISIDGVNWNAVAMLENDTDTNSEYSYPAVIQTEDGHVHVTYTWKRELVKHIVINPDKIQYVPIQEGKWPGLTFLFRMSKNWKSNPALTGSN